MDEVHREIWYNLVDVAILSITTAFAEDGLYLGAIHNTEFNCLSEDKKKELKEFSDFLKR